MIRKFSIAIATATMLALTASVTLAANPHIVGTPSATLSGNTLTVTASVAGLGNVSEATFDLDGTVEVFSRCYNRGGNRPQADNKQETITVDETKTFPVRNGRTNATFTISPLSTLTCPGNQVVVIESVSYNLSLSYEGQTLATFSNQ